MVTDFFHYKTRKLAFCSIDTVVKVFTIAQEMTDSLRNTNNCEFPNIYELGKINENTPE